MYLKTTGTWIKLMQKILTFMKYWVILKICPLKKMSSTEIKSPHRKWFPRRKWVSCDSIQKHLISFSFISCTELKAQVNFSDRLSYVNISQFHPLLQSHWANFNQSWHKASLGKGNLIMFKWRSTPFLKGIYRGNGDNAFSNFKNLFLKNHWANFNQIHGSREFRIVQIKDHALFQLEI